MTMTTKTLVTFLMLLSLAVPCLAQGQTNAVIEVSPQLKGRSKQIQADMKRFAAKLAGVEFYDQIEHEKFNLKAEARIGSHEGNTFVSLKGHDYEYSKGDMQGKAMEKNGLGHVATVKKEGLGKDVRTMCIYHYSYHWLWGSLQYEDDEKLELDPINLVKGRPARYSSIYVAEVSADLEIIHKYTGIYLSNGTKESDTGQLQIRSTDFTGI